MFFSEPDQTTTKEDTGNHAYVRFHGDDGWYGLEKEEIIFSRLQVAFDKVKIILKFITWGIFCL
jgi:hypothetical protein